jgi:glycosyltransferase involved in cell wall biosynthesis
VITVLLCTHNGVRFVTEQLDSLLAQSVSPDRIIISDDASTDGTWEVLRRYAQEHPAISIRRHQPNRVPLPPTESRFTTAPPNTQAEAHPQTGDGRGRAGQARDVPPLPATARNFLDLMVGERDDYLMLCDQDDVWHPDKIAVTLAKMRDMEARYGSDSPCLTHTDLSVVDETLQVINPSFREAMNANWARTTLRDQIVQNTATGCTIMYNRALANLLTEVPRYTVMHDWWLPLVACAFGHMEPLYAATISYRQHGGNVVGAKDMRTFSYKFRLALNLDEINHAVRRTYPQAAELLRIYGADLSADTVAMLATYVNLPALSKLGRVATVVREGFWKTGLARNLAYLLVV